MTVIASTDKAKWILGNWKLNGDSAFVSAYSQEFCTQLKTLPAASLGDIAIGLFPPAPYLGSLKANLVEQVSEQGAELSVLVGAQVCSEALEGAFTGELSANMALDNGAGLCLVGHSERRQLFGETDVIVAAKVQTALKVGLLPVLCVGETLAEREAEKTLSVVEHQLKVVFESLVSEQIATQLLVAYEPVWAIGTGLTATPDQAQSVHAFIREYSQKFLPSGANKVPLLYGGSVKAANAGELMAKADIDGVLVGGASLKAEEFSGIVRAAVEL